MKPMKNNKIFFLLLTLAAAPTAWAQATTEPQDSARVGTNPQKVDVMFRSVDREDLMGGVTTVDMDKLNDMNFSTYTFDNMQAYVGGYNGQLWNNGEALVLIDGVPRDGGSVLPSEVESITFLKAASAVVLYGSRAAHGAILIKTKRAKTDGLQVKVNGNAGLYVPKAYPKYLGSAQYMTLYNEARTNDGLSPVFSDADIFNYASGQNTYRYPEINFFSGDYLKKSSQRYQGTAEFEGGGRMAHFYANIGLYHSNDLMNFGEGKNNHVNRLNVRANIDLRLNDFITGWVNTSVSYYDSRNDLSDFWAQSAIMRPTSVNAFSPLIPIDRLDPMDKASQDLVANSNYVIGGKYLLGGNIINQTNPFAAMYAAGYNKYTSRSLQFDTGIRINLRKVLQGLSFTTRFAVDYATSYNTSIHNDYATYEATWDNINGQDMITSLTKYGVDKRTGTQNVSGSYNRQTILFNAQFDYDRSFGHHNVMATLLANGYQQTTTGVYHRTSNANLALQLNYNYAHRYYADLSMAAVHSAKLAPGYREALSPVLSLAWRMSKEKWLADVKWLDDLKLTASAGIVNEDIDIDGYYLYEGTYTPNGTWWGWSESANSMRTSDSQRGENLGLTFVKRKELRLGIDASILGGAVTLDANYFNTLTDGLVTLASNLFPNYYATYFPSSSFIPYINYNKQRRQGFDWEIAGRKKYGEVDVRLGLTGMYYTSKNTRLSENVGYDWLRGEGQPIETIWGYRCLGYFQNEDDVKNSAVINNNTRPGDLKYEDINGDNIIDANDRVVIGKSMAPWWLGANLTVKFRNFTLFVNGTGNFGGKALKDNLYEWCYGDRKYSDVVLGRWTEANAANATYPRLTTLSGDLNFVASDYWLYSTSAFRINKVQLTYDFPKAMFHKVVTGLKVFLTGTDLLTIAKERKYMETSVGGYPQTRSYTLGATVTF